VYDNSSREKKIRKLSRQRKPDEKRRKFAYKLQKKVKRSPFNTRRKTIIGELNLTKAYLSRERAGGRKKSKGGEGQGCGPDTTGEMYKLRRGNTDDKREPRPGRRFYRGQVRIRKSKGRNRSRRGDLVNGDGQYRGRICLRHERGVLHSARRE